MENPEVYHIHQKLEKEGIILGVNDTSQILNDRFKFSYNVKASIIKPFIYRETGFETEEYCVNLIINADIIIIFGTSLGETDKKWWNYVGKQILSSGNSRLIYCPYDTEKLLVTSKILRKIADLQKFVVSRMGLSSEESAAVLNKIYPIRECKMFNFETSAQMSKNKNRLSKELGVRIL